MNKLLVNTRKSGIVLLMLLLNFSFLSAQKTFKVGEVTSRPGEKSSGFIIVPAGNDCGEIKIPVTVINGTKEGPVLALVAGTHGYEYPPILAMARLSQVVSPQQVSGKIIIVHVANIPSFLKRTIYYNPYDGKNLNRVFPGLINGTSSERIAYMITKEVIDQCDYLIDNHCGDGNEDLMQYLYYTETGNPAVDKISKELAINFNLKVIVHETGRTKDVAKSMYLSNTALLRGKPSISTEAGRLGGTDEEDVNAIIRGSYNTMKYLKMIPGTPELLFESVWVEEYTILTSEQDQGIFTPLLSRGGHVQKGEQVGFLSDYFGNIIQKIYSPFDGIILYIIATPPMSKGEPMVMIGKFKE
jgi:predicted deacylase